MNDDISETLAPKSDQQNFDDYQQGPRTVTVTAVKVIKGDQQPVHIELAEYPGRPYKPNLSMRRVIAKAWGQNSSAWVGHRLTLFGNPDVRYGGKAVGGIEVSHMSNLDSKLTMPLTETRGKKRSFTVQPLKDAPTPTEPTVPDNVRETVERVKGTDSAADYIKWAHDNNAPDHIIEYIKTNLEEN